MNMSKIVLILCCLFSSNIFADSGSTILFKQTLHPKLNELYELELQDIQPSDHIWTAIYLVGRQNYPGLTSKADLVIENQGLLNQADANEFSIHQPLIAENLIQTNLYSFKQFNGLKKLIESSSAQLIEDPNLENTDTIRIYSQINDWIPQYNSYGPTQVRVGIQNSIDFDIVAIYVLVGKGEKPAELSELNFRNVPPSDETETIKPEPPKMAQIENPNNKFSRSEKKLILFVVVTAVIALFAFIHRRKLKHFS